MSKFYIIFYALILGYMPISLNGYQYDEQAQLVNAIIEKASKKLEKQHQMNACGFGSGMPSGVVEMLALSFDKVGPLSKEEGREIVVKSTQELINIVNKDEKIRPFLKNFPFTAQNIEIRLFVQDKSGRKIFSPNYCVISSFKGSIDYRYKIENQLKYCKEETESFAEALQKVKSSH